MPEPQSPMKPSPLLDTRGIYMDSFEAVMVRENRTKGFFIAFDYSQDALTEIDAFFRHTGKAVIRLTVTEILEEQIARKLA